MIKRTRSGYPRLAPSDDPDHLEAYFGLEHSTDKEQETLQSYRDPDAQAAFLLAVRCLAHLGYMPDLEIVPDNIRRYAAKQLSTELPVTYFRERPARRTEILAAARTTLGVQKWTGKQLDKLKEVMLALALDYPREADLVSAAVDHLREWRIELPVEDTLITQAESALHQVERDTYEEVMRRADERVTAAIDRLLNCPEDEYSLLEMVKRPAGRAGINSMGREADKLAALANLNIPDDLLVSLGQRKITFLAEQANRYSAADVRSLSDQRRALILLAFVVRRRQLGRDTMLEQMEKILRRMNRDSENGETDAVVKREKKTPYNRRLSTRILAIIATSEPGKVEENLFAYMPQAEYKKIYDAVTAEEEDFAKKTARASLLRRFEGHYRKMLPLLLTHVPFQAESAEGKEIVETLGLLKQLPKRMQEITLRKRPRFLDSAWDDVTVLPLDEKAAKSEVLTPESLTAARRPVELQTILALQGALKSGTVWVEGSERYSNLAKTLVPWDESQRAAFYEKHKFPATAREFATKLIALMHEALSDLEAAVKRGRDVWIIQEKFWGVPKLQEQPVPKSIRGLEEKIYAYMGYPKITEVLADSDATLGLSESFVHYADKETRATKNKRRDILATLFCDAANIGPAKMAHTAPDLSIGTILGTQRWYNYVENLRQGTILCNNYVNQSGLARYWGDGKTVSFDGMQLATYDNNTRAELHSRYLNGVGGLFLQHVTNKLTGLYGQFARCSSPEAAHLLAGLLNHGTELDITTADTDSIGDHTLAIGLGWLLGFTIRPRIKRIKYARLVRPAPGVSFGKIDPMFSRNLNTRLIEENYDEVVHLVCSLAEKTVSSELVIKRFNSYSRKSGLHQALLEIGRAVHTIFVARYLEDEDLRREIHRNLCHGEAWNGMTRQIFSFNRAVMRENDPDEQERLALSLLMVQNMIVVWNVSHLSKAISQLKREGYQFDPADLRHITPLLTQHIRMMPDFVIDFDLAHNMNDMIKQPI